MGGAVSAIAGVISAIKPIAKILEVVVKIVNVLKETLEDPNVSEQEVKNKWDNECQNHQELKNLSEQQKQAMDAYVATFVLGHHEPSEY
jgi:hypothetical protein